MFGYARSAQLRGAAEAAGRGEPVQLAVECGEIASGEGLIDAQALGGEVATQQAAHARQRITLPTERTQRGGIVPQVHRGMRVDLRADVCADVRATRRCRVGECGGYRGTQGFNLCLLSRCSTGSGDGSGSGIGLVQGGNLCLLSVCELRP